MMTQLTRYFMFACLAAGIVSTAPTSFVFGQEYSIDEYLKDPTFINARRFVRQGANVVPELVAGVSKNDADSVACLRAICCSLEQTEGSRKLVEGLAAQYEEQPLIGAYALLADWLNHPKDFSRFQRLAENEYGLVSDDFLMETGDRGLFAIADAICSADVDDAEALDDLLFLINGQETFPCLSKIAEKEIDRWINIALKSKNGEAIGVVGGLFELCNGDQKEREWVKRLLDSEVALVSLSDLSKSARLQLLFTCLKRLERREISRERYERLIAVFSVPQLETGPENETDRQWGDRRDTLLGILAERYGLMRLQDRLGNEQGYALTWGDSPDSIPVFSSQWVVDTAAKLLLSDIAEVRAMTRMQLIQVAESKWIEAEQRTQAVIDELVEFNTETSLVQAAKLMEKIPIAPRHRDMLIRWTRQKEETHTPVVAFEAARTLANIETEKNISVQRVYQAQAIAFSQESSEGQRTSQLMSLANDNLRVALPPIAEFLRESSDMELKIELLNYLTQRLGSERGEAPSINMDLTALADAILANLGNSGVFDAKSESLLIQHQLQTRDAFRQYKQFYEQAENQHAKQMVGHLLLQITQADLQIPTGELESLLTRHPDLIASTTVDFTEIALSLGRITAASQSKTRNDESSRAVALDRLLNGQRSALVLLAEMANSEDSPGRESARQTLKDWAEAVDQALKGKLEN